MRKSYVREKTLQVVVEIDLWGIETLIEIAEGAASAEGAGWRVREALEKLKVARREAAADAVRELSRIAE
jgi:hypothetical protein